MNEFDTDGMKVFDNGAILIERIEDMSHDGKLSLMIEPDGDIIIACHGHGMDGRSPRRSEVQFCACASGGGKSPRTRKALHDLMMAMAKDNEEYSLKSPSKP